MFYLSSYPDMFFVNRTFIHYMETMLATWPIISTILLVFSNGLVKGIRTESELLLE